MNCTILYSVVQFKAGEKSLNFTDVAGKHGCETEEVLCFLFLCLFLSTVFFFFLIVFEDSDLYVVRKTFDKKMWCHIHWKIAVSFNMQIFFCKRGFHTSQQFKEMCI